MDGDEVLAEDRHQDKGPYDAPADGGFDLGGLCPIRPIKSGDDGAG